MKLLYYYDNNWKLMKEQFELHLKDDFDLRPLNTDKIDPATYLAPCPFKPTGGVVDHSKTDKSNIGGGIGSWLTKVDMIITAIETGDNDEVITVADTDIRFYKPVIPTIKKYTEGVDICFQKERHISISNKEVNIGFISMKCNKVVIDFWKHVKDIIQREGIWDQQIVNKLLRENYPINFRHFPGDIFCMTQRQPTRNMILHHANAAKTQEQKLNQFKSVRKIWRREFYRNMQDNE